MLFCSCLRRHSCACSWQNGMRTGSGMSGVLRTGKCGRLALEGDTWREDHHLRQPWKLCRPVTGAKSAACVALEIEIDGKSGEYLDKHMCVENIKLGGDAGEFPGSANQSGTIIIGGKTYFAEAEMTKGSITIKVMAKILPSYQRMELVKLERRQLPEVRRRSGREWKRRDLCLQFSSTVTLISQDGNRMDGCNYFGVL